MTIFASLGAAALGLALLATPGLARDMRHPAAGEPALTVSFPDDWTANTVADGSTLSIVNPDHRIGFSLTVTTSGGDSIDDILRSMVKGTKGTMIDKQNASLSGHAGETYIWTYTNAHDIKLRVTATIVKLGGQVASCSKIEIDNNSAAHRELAETVMQSIRIIPPGAGPSGAGPSGAGK
jgi:hypothetical protein